ncbi:hypothetical protein [Paraburkholderia sp.]|nr:hypothetical protein [Paraburkholderia sp.]
MHNSWFALHHPIRMYLSQIVFLLFVVCTVRTVWQGAVSGAPALRAVD